MRKFTLPSLLLLSLSLGAQDVTPPSQKPTPVTNHPTSTAAKPAQNASASPIGADALALYNAGKYQAALSQTEQEINTNPNNMDARTIRTWALVALGRYSDAEKLAINSLKISPRDIRLIEILGEAYFYQNKLDKALAQFGEYAELAPKGVRIGRVYSFMGDVYLAKSMLAQAEFAYTASTITVSNSIALWMKIGESRLRLKNDQTARQAFERVLQLAPTNEQAIEYLKSL